MFEILFKRSKTIAHHRKAPYLKAREQFLKSCASKGYSHSMLKKIAWVLCAIAPEIDIQKGKITTQDIEQVINNGIRFKHSSQNSQFPESTRQLFVHISTEWMRSIGCFQAPCEAEGAFSTQISAYVKYLSEEKGLSPSTISTRCERLGWFFQSLDPSRSCIGEINIADVDAFIDEKGKQGWKRSSLSSLASSLRCFFRYAESKNWCMPGISTVIDSPRIYALEGLPKGPKWEDVQRLLASTIGDSPNEIRARAILMLLAVYGFRRGEVARLQLNDLDWGDEQIMLSRPKQRRIQYYPLLHEVGEAILRYLKEARPYSRHRNLFLTLAAPIRPLSASSISAIVRSRLKALGIVLPCYGAHCLRHACASHLLTSGFTLKQIGDYLGHHTANSTIKYTKIDLAGLRQVSEFDLGGLL
ncbi:tyrosine-type recombinase/integrase [Desulfobacter sp.]|uniref:tyrosine-type recombinase/integrase n=1 Tax=Desulfobacter sp. TaxID=2294 RepID=UPI003D097C82